MPGRLLSRLLGRVALRFPALFAGFTEYAVDGASLSMMDVNGDGKPDVISGTEVVAGSVKGTRSFSVLGNSGDSGTVAFASVQHFPAANAPFFSCSADMNGDSKPDVVAWDTTAAGAAQIVVFLNNGSGNTISFDGGTKYGYVTTYPGPPGKIVVRDLDGDGKPDVLTVHTVYSGDTSYLTFLQNMGSGGSVSLVQQPDLIAQLL